MGIIVEIAGQNPKTGAVVATATAGMSLGGLLDLIPDDISKLGTLVGIILSCVLIYAHLSRDRIQRRKAALELEILERKEAERLDRLEARRQAGAPIRRDDDLD